MRSPWLCEAHFDGRDYLKDRSGLIYAAYLTLAGENARALEVYQRVFEYNSNPAAGLCAALRAEQLQKLELPDQLVQDVIEKGGRYRYDGKPTPEPIELARMFQASLSGGGELELEAVEQLIKGDPQVRRSICYLVACFLEDRSPAQARLFVAWSTRHTRIPLLGHARAL